VNVECHGRIEAVADAWDALAERQQAVPWLRAGWIGAWQRAFGAGMLQIYVLERNGRLAGVLPLVERRLRELHSPTNDHTPTFGVLGEDAAAVRELASHVFSQQPRHVSLSYLEPEGADVQEVSGAAESAGFRVLRTAAHAPYLALQSDWSTYEEQLSGNLRGDVRRRRRRLEALGAFSVEIADGRNRLDALLDEGFRVEASGWKGSRGTAIASSSATRGFYTEIARWAAERGWLRLGFARLDGRPIAFQYGLEVDGVYTYLKAGYDPGFARFSPGKVLLHATVRHAFAEGLKIYDFLASDEPWKLAWADTTRELQRVQAFAPSAGGMLEWGSYVYGRPLAKRLLGPLKRRLGL